MSKFDIITRLLLIVLVVFFAVSPAVYTFIPAFMLGIVMVFRFYYIEFKKMNDDK